MLRPRAPFVVQVRVADWPGVIVGGFAWKSRSSSFATVTFTLAGAEVPPGPVATAVKVVVSAGWMSSAPLGPTLPIIGVMVTDVAFVLDQAMFDVLSSPPMVVGLAVKVTVGGPDGPGCSVLA